MTQTELRRKALSIIEARRQQAQTDAQSRQQEIYRKIPEIAETKRMLADSASRLSAAILRKDGRLKENLEQIKRDNTEGSRLIKQLLVQNGFPEDFLEVHYRCKFCEDTGFLENSMCDCLKRLMSRLACEELDRSANMPDADFEHFSLNYYKGIVIDGTDCYSKMSEVADFCKRYADSFGPASKSILMMGKTGVGKTHLSMAVAKEAARKGYNVVYGSVMELIRTVEKEHFGRGEEDSDTLQILTSCDLLVMDDLGSELHTSIYEAALYNIINARINKGIPTIISTNYSFEEMSSVYNERIISRLGGCFELLLFCGRDIRQLKSMER